MALAIQDTTQRILLSGIQWYTYEALLTDVGDSHVAYLTYDQGILEIMVPSFSHEQLNRVLAAVVEAIAMGMRRDFVNAGSTTFKRQDVGRGFEPDSSFYIQHAEVMRGHTALDLQTDPPPDLVLEIDITHPSFDKLPMYAAMGIPEVWRYDGQHLTIYHLMDGTYTAVESSVALSGITAQQLEQFVALSTTLPRHAWFATIQAQVQQH